MLFDVDQYGARAQADHLDISDKSSIVFHNIE